MITYLLPGVTVEFEPDRISLFVGSDEPVDLIPSDQDGVEELSAYLELSPDYCCLLSELARIMVVNLVLEKVYEKPVVNDLQIDPPEEDAMVTALVCYTLNKHEALLQEPGEHFSNALLQISTKMDLDHLAATLEWLIEAPIGSTLDLRHAQW